MIRATIILFVTPAVLSCVLLPLVTIKQPICEKQNCTNQNSRKKRNSDEGLNRNIPLVELGSASLQHFQSLHDNNNLENRIEFLAEGNGYCAVDSKYRNIDGSCNNLKQPNWGMSNSIFSRILHPSYSSAPDKSRLSTSGNPLPLPRYISTTLFPFLDRPWVNYTLTVMQWGQLLAHDSGMSPSTTDEDINCCQTPNLPVCYPIVIPKNDQFYSLYNQTCINMIRTKNEQLLGEDCRNIVYQINEVTSYIDMSFLYGNNLETVYSLRSFQKGLLEPHYTLNFKQFPKLSNNPILDCGAPYNNSICFYSGDGRVNQNTQLTCLQTILFREHNRIALELSQLNPSWTDEILFQESKTILTAMFQHISYNEWLPLILGDDYMRKNNLFALESNYTAYNDDIRSNTMSEFMAAAYRIFHSQIKGRLTMYNESKCPFTKAETERCPFRSINISDYMNSPGIITEDDNFDALLLGLTIDLSQKTDRYFTTEMTEKMFHGNLSYGEDLESFDIQRGRDFGLPSYNTYRQICNLTKAQNFSDLIGEFTEENIILLQTVYESVDDIDLFVGCLMENWVPDASIGPTALCIIGEEFVRKKFGDRFWYEAGGSTHSFTPDQLEEIRKSTFSRLLCDNSDNITTIQPNSFKVSSIPGNAIVNCSTLPKVNLTKWKQ